jgi:hypothetical protein
MTDSHHCDLSLIAVIDGREASNDSMTPYDHDSPWSEEQHLNRILAFCTHGQAEYGNTFFLFRTFEFRNSYLFRFSIFEFRI